MGFNSAFKGLNAKLNPICHLLTLLGAHHIFHVSKIRANYSNKLHCSFEVSSSFKTLKAERSAVYFFVRLLGRQQLLQYNCKKEISTTLNRRTVSENGECIKKGRPNLPDAFRYNYAPSRNFISCVLFV